jgi:hypothetical protein
LPGITSVVPVTKSSLIGAGTSAPGYTGAVNAANPLTSSVGAGTSAPGYTSAANAVKPISPVHVIHPPNPTVGTVANAATKVGEEEGSKGILGSIGDYLKKNPMMALGLGAQAVGSLSKMFASSGGKKKGSKKLGKYSDVDSGPVFADASYRPGYDNEHNYFPNYNYNAYAARGGLVRGYANGGIVSLAAGGPVDLQAQMPQDMSFPLNGVPGTDEAPMLEDIPSSSFPTSQIGSTPEPAPEDTASAPTANDHELIAQTVEAIQGKIPDPGPILLAFVNEFGEPALQDLAMRVKSQGQGQKGPGDGTSDSINARLSDGEFVVPADAVSHLGNGSTEAGGQQLQSMVDNVRMAKTGSPGMPPPVDPTQGGIMSMMSGGLVRGYKDGGQVRQFPPDLDREFLLMNDQPLQGRELGPQFGPPDPLDDLDQYRPGMIPEMIDQWIPSVQGYAATGDFFATTPEIRRADAKIERRMQAEARRKH